MLLAAAPETVRREVISTRKMQSVHILFLLMCRYQPGGVHEKTSLLRDLTESRVSTSTTSPRTTTSCEGVEKEHGAS